MKYRRLHLASPWLIALLCLSFLFPAFPQAQESIPKLMEKGRKALSSGRYDEAAAAYKELIRLKPDNAVFHFLLGSIYWELERFEDAVVEYKEVIQLFPEEASAHYGLGGAYFQLGRYEEALSAFKETVKLNSDIAEAHRGLGWTYGKLGRFEEAMGAFKDALRLEPNDAEAHLGLGLAHFQMGNREGVVKEYTILKKLDRDRAQQLFNLSLTKKDGETRSRSILTSEKDSLYDSSILNRLIGLGLFAIGGFIYQGIFNFLLGLLSMLGFGVMALPGVGIRWIQDKFGGASERLERVQDGLAIAFWSGPIYLFLTVLTIGLQASAVTMFVGYFTQLYPANATIYSVMGWLWLFGTIGFSGLIVYAVALFVLKLWLGGLGIFWALMRVLPKI